MIVQGKKIKCMYKLSESSQHSSERVSNILRLMFSFGGDELPKAYSNPGGSCKLVVHMQFSEKGCCTKVWWLIQRGHSVSQER